MKPRTLKQLVYLAGLTISTSIYSQGVLLPAESFNAEQFASFLLCPPDKTVRCRDIVPKLPGASGEQKRAEVSVLLTFPTNSAEITPKTAQSLDEIGRAFADPKLGLGAATFAIEGHADPRGTDEYNLLLSEARAQNVVRYLVKNKQISSNRLSPVGRGESQVLNLARPSDPVNRRVTFVRLK